MWSTIIIYAFLLCAAQAADSDPVVTTKYGQLRGKVVTTKAGTCDAFFGVPFAAPPVGDLRWKKPQEPPAWTGIKDAKNFSPACIQAGSNGTDPKMDSEDCLYLNLFVPKSDKAQKLPVMLFIHGGVFQVGKASDFSQDGACENIASRGVIVLFIQYRLGLYGFVSTGDEAALGNFGIWDQVAALRWVKENIGAFGGDPNEVTIFGESAGGISVSYLTYTQIAKDLFKRSITESGSAYFPEAALKDTSIGTTKQLARSANCTSTTSEAYISCLRRLSTADLQAVYNSMIPPMKQFFFDQWSIRVDGELYTQSRLEEIDVTKPVVIGVNSLEMPVANPKDIPNAQSLFNQTLDGIVLANGSKADIIKQLARYAYLDSKGDPKDNVFVCQQANMMSADYKFKIGPAKEAGLKAAVGRPVWVFNFDHYNDAYFPPGYPFQKGAWHGHELCYIFMLIDNSPFAKCPAEYTGDHKTVADYMGEMWTNFAKTGKPSPKEIDWPQFHNVSNANALHIQAKLSIQKNFYVDVVNFWNYLVPNVEQAMQ